jgi:antitoxin VapB
MKARVTKAKVFMNGRSQAVRIPAEYRFASEEVYIRRDPQNGDLILSEAPGDWDEIFAALDRAGIPDDFMADRGEGPPQQRDEL